MDVSKLILKPSGEVVNIKDAYARASILSIGGTLEEAIANEALARQEADNTINASILSIGEIVDDNKYFVAPEEYGAVADGITDCSEAIQKAIDENPNKTIYFRGGTYLINSTINGKLGIHFLLSGGATIKAGASMKVMIFNDIAIQSGDSSMRDHNSFIKGGTLDGDFKCDIVYAFNHAWGISVRDVYIKHFNETAIHTQFTYDGTNSGMSASNILDNILIDNRGVNPNYTTYGIYNYGADNFLSNITTIDCKIGFYLRDGNVCYNLHPWLNNPAQLYGGSIAYLCENSQRLVACTNDTLQTSIKMQSNVAIVQLVNFRHAYHVTDISIIRDNGGYLLYDVQAPTYRILADNTYYQIEYNEANLGKFCNDDVYNADPSTYYRWHLSNSLKTDVFNSQVSNVIEDWNDLAFNGVPIPANSNLNSYTYPGKFCTTSTAITASLSNLPTGFTGPIQLIVKYIAGGWRMQTVYSSNANAFAFRYITGSTQNAWKIIPTPTP